MTEGIDEQVVCHKNYTTFAYHHVLYNWAGTPTDNVLVTGGHKPNWLASWPTNSPGL